jgi:hypothetical protein
MIKIIAAAFLAFAFMAPAQAQPEAGVVAHSGGTDQNGCHIDHKTGIRHCH